MLPYAMAFAAGAMIFVVVEEVIPESQRGGNTDLATLAAMTGFAVMMTLAWFLVWFFIPQPDVQRDPHPLTIKRAVINYGRLMKEREPAAAVVAFFLMFLSFGLYVYYMPSWLEQDIGLTGT